MPLRSIAWWALSQPRGFWNPREYAPGYTHARFRMIRVGMTEDEVFEILGQPMRTYPGPAGEVWAYSSVSFDGHSPSSASPRRAGSSSLLLDSRPLIVLPKRRRLVSLGPAELVHSHPAVLGPLEQLDAVDFVVRRENVLGILEG